MIVLVALTVGLVLWIVGWSLGVKGFDAFLVTALITFVAAGVRLVMPFVQNLMQGPSRPGS